MENILTLFCVAIIGYVILHLAVMLYAAIGLIIIDIQYYLSNSKDRKLNRQRKIDEESYELELRAEIKRTLNN